VKTSEKSIFHQCETHIISPLDVSVLYINFRGLEASAQNSKVLAFDFFEKCLFTMKIGQKSIFHHRETHILARLDIMVLFTIFLGF
jgi:hypothetical protein